jgi:hypothetical protein
VKTKVTLYCFYWLLFGFIFQAPLLYAQVWEWGQQAKGIPLVSRGNTYGGTVSTNKYGNAYISGNYEYEMSFRKDTLTQPLSYSVYLVKYDSLGNLIWATQTIPGRNDLYSGGWGVTNCTDNSGNIVVLGYVTDTLYFGPYKVIAPISQQQSIFLAKYNSNGMPLWAEYVIPYPTGYTFSIATDNSDNIFITGDSCSNGHVFIAKYNANGVLAWKRSTGIILTSYEVGARAITTDKEGSSYATGFFEKGSMIFGTDTLHTNFSPNAYLIKYDSAGNFEWARQPKTKADLDTISGNAFCLPTALASDKAGNIYLAGWFIDTLIFGTYTISAPPYSDDSVCMFLVKYDSHGNVLWAKSSPPNFLSVPLSLATDTLNHIYIGGEGISTTKFENFVLHPKISTVYNSFLIELDTTGKVLCGSLLNEGAISYTPGVEVTSDPSGKYIYLGGINKTGDSVFCGPDTLVANINDGYDPYVARWIPCNYVGEGINEVKGESKKVKVYPNPSNGVFTIALVRAQNPFSNRNVPSTIEIYNVLGQSLLTESLVLTGTGGFRSAKGDNLINISSQPSGIYFYRVISEDGNLLGEGKVIVQK